LLGNVDAYILCEILSSAYKRLQWTSNPSLWCKCPLGLGLCKFTVSLVCDCCVAAMSVKSLLYDCHTIAVSLLYNTHVITVSLIYSSRVTCVILLYDLCHDCLVNLSLLCHWVRPVCCRAASQVIQQPIQMQVGSTANTASLPVTFTQVCHLTTTLSCRGTYK